MKKRLVVAILALAIFVSFGFFVLAENNTSSGGNSSNGTLYQYNGTIGNVSNFSNTTNSSSGGGGSGGGNCTDSDGGRNLGTAGTTTGYNGSVRYTQNDSCYSQTGLYEFYCLKTGQIAYAASACPSGYLCLNGACNVPAPTNVSCTDSDGGANRDLRGTVNAINSTGYYEFTDYCVNSTVVYEYACSENRTSNSLILCPSGTSCSYGYCNNNSGTPRGEEGNNTGQMYDEIVTCVFRGTDSRQSCYIASETGYYGCSAINGSCRVSVGDYYGQLTWKSSCGGYQYTTTDGRNEEIFFVCNGTSGSSGSSGEGNGSGSTNDSEGSPRDSGSEDNEEGKALTCESGCPSGDTCYPIGYRKGGNYCMDSGEFVKQLSGENACENNFECSSNLCVSNQCVSESLIQKILNWFRNMFGN